LKQVGTQEPTQESLPKVIQGNRTEPPTLVWVAVAVPVLVHFYIAIGHLNTGKSFGHADASLLGGIGGWILRYYGSVDNQSVFALWILALLGYAIYASAAKGGTLVDGVSMFVRNIFAIVLILAIATPAVWIVFRNAGPQAAELVAPVVLTLGAVFLIRGGARRSLVNTKLS
jgi:cellulose synthase/poly-beta-1,6-N-acetylglucosamine synthase-like glycosyltransferase